MEVRHYFYRVLAIIDKRDTFIGVLKASLSLRHPKIMDIDY